MTEPRSFVEKISGTERYFASGIKRLATFSNCSKLSPDKQSASANPPNRAANSISTNALRPSRKQAKQIASSASVTTPSAYSSKTTQGGTTFEKLPAAAGGFVSARGGYAVTSILAAEQGAVMPRQMSVFTHAGAAGLPSGSGGSGQTIHNHRNNVNITVHQQGQKMTPDEITTAVRRGMRMGY
jgi:hypothetical protein